MGRDYPEAGLCIRLDGMIGIDVDHYGGKNGGDHLRKFLKSRIGVLPASIRISSRFRGTVRRRVRHQALPNTSGLPISSSSGMEVGALSGVDLVRRAHRNANAHPTVHKRGTQYGYMDESSGVITYGSATASRDAPGSPQAMDRALASRMTRSLGERKDLRSRVRRSVDPSELEWVSADEVPCARMKRCWMTPSAHCGVPSRGTSYALASILRLARAGEGGRVGVGAALKALEEPSRSRRVLMAQETTGSGNRSGSAWWTARLVLVADDPTPGSPNVAAAKSAGTLGGMTLSCGINDIAPWLTMSISASGGVLMAIRKAARQDAWSLMCQRLRISRLQ